MMLYTNKLLILFSSPVLQPDENVGREKCLLKLYTLWLSVCIFWPFVSLDESLNLKSFFHHVGGIFSAAAIESVGRKSTVESKGQTLESVPQNQRAKAYF